ncbi:MAG: hypothetical protein NT076_00340 [Candidatus Pacearchaeota archaeon]|nr:hypothetical protein [Candidatus Pacearchaeota archaeon]
MSSDRCPCADKHDDKVFYCHRTSKKCPNKGKNYKCCVGII